MSISSEHNNVKSWIDLHIKQNGQKMITGIIGNTAYQKVLNFALAIWNMKGQPDGLATLNSTQKLTESQRPTTDGIAEGTTKLYNRQPDWNQADDTAPDYIKNKPDVGGGSGSALPLAPATITLWAAADYRDNQIKKTIAAYYDDATKHLEQRFDWNTDLSVSRIEIKDELTGVWVQRNYTWTAGIPSVSETTITAWTIT